LFLGLLFYSVLGVVEEAAVLAAANPLLFFLVEVDHSFVHWLLLVSFLGDAATVNTTHFLLLWLTMIISVNIFAALVTANRLCFLLVLVLCEYNSLVCHLGI
jgi:hypothetical protein